MRKINNHEILLEGAYDKAAEVASKLFATFSVKDISISEPALETIIESIYLNFCRMQEKSEQKMQL